MNRHGRHLETTSRIELEPIGVYGEPVWRNSDHIRETLRTRLSAAHANIFAVPSQRDDGDSTDWFAPMDGDVTRWDQLSIPEQLHQAEKVEGFMRDITTATKKLRDSGARGAEMICDSIDAACYLGSTQHLFIVADQPVAATWGMKISADSNLPSVLPVLSRFVDLPIVTEPKPNLSHVLLSRRLGGWFKSLLIGLPVLLLIALLVLVSIFRDDIVFPALNKLWRDWASNDAEITLTIPEEAIKSGDLSFLEGRWESISGLISIETGEDIVVEYEFDESGRGHAWVLESDQRCETTATAFFKGQTLVIREETHSRCPDGRTYVRSDVICTIGIQGVASCIAKQPGIEDVAVDMLRK
jgi:hypothetical protein